MPGILSTHGGCFPVRSIATPMDPAAPGTYSFLDVSGETVPGNTHNEMERNSLALQYIRKMNTCNSLDKEGLRTLYGIVTSFAEVSFNQLDIVVRQRFERSLRLFEATYALAFRVEAVLDMGEKHVAELQKGHEEILVEQYKVHEKWAEGIIENLRTKEEERQKAHEEYLKAMQAAIQRDREESAIRLNGIRNPPKWKQIVIMVAMFAVLLSCSIMRTAREQQQTICICNASLPEMPQQSCPETVTPAPTALVPTTTQQSPQVPITPPRYTLLGTATPTFRSCTPIRPGSTLESDGFDQEELRDSLRYHLLYGSPKLSSVCAIHVGMPYCYCLMSVPGDGVIELHNPIAAGYTVSHFIESRERHLECERSAIIKRYKTVWINYQDAKGVKVAGRRFDDRQAIDVQHILELNKGHFRCTEEMGKTLERYFLSMRDLDPYKPNEVKWILDESPLAEQSNPPVAVISEK